MNALLDQAKIDFYNENGYVVIEDFLTPEELENWRASVSEAIKDRNGIKIPGKSVMLGESDGINEDAEYYSKVFDQLLNLWQTNARMKDIMLDARIGKMAAELSGSDGIRIWHDQALIKRPWGNPTAWHLDTPFWSFSDRRAISMWVALDDATLQNGCMYFIPGSHKETSFGKTGIGKNMDIIFETYPQFKQRASVATPIKAGSCTFHNGLTIHGAGANMTPGFRRAMTCAYMPDGNIFNGEANILSDEYLQTLKIGDLLQNDEQNPLIYHKNLEQVLNKNIPEASVLQE